jgi:hypothetical protein
MLGRGFRWRRVRVLGGPQDQYHLWQLSFSRRHLWQLSFSRRRSSAACVKIPCLQVIQTPSLLIQDQVHIHSRSLYLPHRLIMWPCSLGSSMLLPLLALLSCDPSPLVPWSYFPLSFLLLHGNTLTLRPFSLEPPLTCTQEYVTCRGPITSFGEGDVRQRAREVENAAPREPKLHYLQ